MITGSIQRQQAFTKGAYITVAGSIGRNGQQISKGIQVRLCAVIVVMPLLIFKYKVTVTVTRGSPAAAYRAGSGPQAVVNE